MQFSDFADMCIDTVLYRPVTGRDAYGAATFGPQVSLTARVVDKVMRVTSRVTGDDVISGTQAWVAPMQNINVDDEFTLPSGKKPNLINWSQYPDDEGLVFCKLYFK